MSTSQTTIEYVEDQLAGLSIRTAKMFGEYAVYLDGKVVAFVCDDIFFLKPVGLDEVLIEGTTLAHAYPGSKLYHAVSGDQLEDRQWLAQVVQATADAQPVPPPKKPRASSRKPRGSTTQP